MFNKNMTIEDIETILRNDFGRGCTYNDKLEDYINFEYVILDVHTEMYPLDIDNNWFMQISKTRKNVFYETVFDGIADDDVYVIGRTYTEVSKYIKENYLKYLK